MLLVTDRKKIRMISVNPRGNAFSSDA